MQKSIELKPAGDMKAAEDLLRIKSGAKASKAAGRIAAEGMIGAYIAPDGKSGALVEVNCETDFVAQKRGFHQFRPRSGRIGDSEHLADTEALAAAALPRRRKSGRVPQGAGHEAG